MDVARVNGVELNYLSRGNGSHAILCIPGALGSAPHQYKPQLDHFGRDGSDFRIISFNPRGFGENSKTERPQENALETDASDGYELMKFLSIEEFSLLGWCSGGMACMFLASNYPQVVKKLIVFGAKAYSTDEEIQLYETIRDIKNWEESIYQEMVGIYGSSLQSKWSHVLDSRIKHHTLNKGDICMKALPKILCPTLIIHGAKDKFCPAFHASYLRDHIDKSQLEIIAEGRHALHFKYKQKFNQLVEEFLKAPINNNYGC